MKTKLITTRILIVGTELHQSEQLTSRLRAGGLQVLADFADNNQGVRELLERKSFDLVLFSLGLAEFSLQQAQQLIAATNHQIALIGMADEVNNEMMLESINHDVQDVVVAENLEHLVHVVKRETRHLQMQRLVARLENDYFESEERCQSLLASSRDAVAYIYQGMHTFANASYLTMFEISDFDALEGTSIIDLVAPRQQAEAKEFLRELGQNRNVFNELDFHLIKEGGESFTAKLEFSVATYDGEPCHQVLIRAQADTAALEAEIEFLHQHDVVTGLHNRQHFQHRLEQLLNHTEVDWQDSAVLYFSIDQFQSIRDQIGISGCDSLVSKIAKIMITEASEIDLVARFGAHSYACLLPAADLQASEGFATNVIKRVAQEAVEINHQSVSSTLSAAITLLVRDHAINSNQLMTHLEINCESAQSLGGNRVQVVPPETAHVSTQNESNDDDAGDGESIAVDRNNSDGIDLPADSTDKDQVAEAHQGESNEITSDHSITEADSDLIDQSNHIEPPNDVVIEDESDWSEADDWEEQDVVEEEANQAKDQQISNMIKQAIDEKRIKGLYQPIVGLKTEVEERYISCLQVLSEEGLIIDEKEYQQAIERTGTIKMLDRWKILHAIKKITDTRKIGRIVDFLVPLSLPSMQDPTLVSWISNILKRSEINGNQLIFLIKEADIAANLSEAKSFFSELEQLNCQLGFDEFGINLDGLKLHAEIKAGYLRIDKAHLKNLATNEASQESIIEMTTEATDLGIKTVIPDVDEPALLGALWSLNVDFVHGDLLQPPKKELDYDFRTM